MLRCHCAHARLVWNLAVEQQSHWRPGRKSAPGYLEQCRQLTQARAAHDWLREGSQMVQQQALRDFAQAMANFFAATHRRPTWRKAGLDEGFRIVAVKPGHIRRSNRRGGEVWIPKAGWVRFRWSRAIPAGVEDLRVKDMTRSARGTMVDPGRNVRQKAELNRGILASAWGLLVRRLEEKAPGRVEKIHPAFTSQRCSACGHVAADSRESQALFRCVACGYACNADVNAARNIAAGHAVTARGGDGVTRPVNREPQLLAS
jgi:transposase